MLTRWTARKMKSTSANSPVKIRMQKVLEDQSRTVKSRSVGMDELFYDLVYAYAISNLTGILESASETGFSVLSAAIYLVMFIVLVNSWMYQMVYTNRYGESKTIDSVFTYVQAVFLLYISSSLQSSLQKIFVPFTAALSGLSFILFLEYLLAYCRRKNSDDKPLIQSFLLMTGTRTLLIGLGVLFPVRIGLWISLSGILLGWIMPLFFQKRMREHPVDFAHLSERLSLLVILMFGEMIVSLAVWFSPQKFSLSSLLAFAVSALLFQCYTLVYRHIHSERPGTYTGVHAIYLHYLILIGLNLTASSVEKLPEDQANLLQFSAILFAGLLLFFTGLYGCLIYLQCAPHKGLKRMRLSLLIPAAFWITTEFIGEPQLVLFNALLCAAAEYGILRLIFQKKISGV